MSNYKYTWVFIGGNTLTLIPHSVRAINSYDYEKPDLTSTGYSSNKYSRRFLSSETEEIAQYKAELETLLLIGAIDKL